MALRENKDGVVSFMQFAPKLDYLDPAIFAEVFHNGFFDLISGLIFQDIMQEGALFVCNAAGEIMESNVSSEFFSQKEAMLLFDCGVSWDKSNIGFSAVHLCKTSLKVEHMKSSEHSLIELKSLDSLAVPIFSDTLQLIGILALVVQSDNSQHAMFFLKNAAILFRMCLTLNLERALNESKEIICRKQEKESKKHEFLLRASKNIYSKTDVDSVLSETIQSLMHIFPNAETSLFLSQDNQSSNLPIEPLVLDETQDDLCTHAYMRGEIFSSRTDAQILIYAPLCGRQGVYGVLNLRMDFEVYEDSDMDYITTLAESAGIAFENAKLYEHSNLLIKDLRLINEITRRLNQSLKSQDIFDLASKELLGIFDADYGCILKLNEETNELIVQASNLPSFYNETFSADYGYSGIVFNTKESILVSDYNHHHDIESRLMEMTESRSLMATPILVNSKVLGVILLTHHKANFFSYENFRLLQVISGHIGMAMTNAYLHAEVRKMVVTDHLTGLYTRSYLDEQVNILQKKDFSGSLIIVDIDYFKKINDTYGHQAGDLVLMQVSKIIASSIRDSDTAARWGGEEFAIYLPQSSLEQTMNVAERIRLRIHEETNPQVSISCGISEWNSKHEKISVESLFHKADIALYIAKESGRNQIKVG